MVQLGFSRENIVINKIQVYILCKGLEQPVFIVNFYAAHTFLCTLIRVYIRRPHHESYIYLSKENVKFTWSKYCAFIILIGGVLSGV